MSLLDIAICCDPGSGSRRSNVERSRVCATTASQLRATAILYLNPKSDQTVERGAVAGRRAFVRDVSWLDEARWR